MKPFRIFQSIRCENHASRYCYTRRRESFNSILFRINKLSADCLELFTQIDNRRKKRQEDHPDTIENTAHFIEKLDQLTLSFRDVHCKIINKTSDNKNIWFLGRYYT